MCKFWETSLCFSICGLEKTSRQGHLRSELCCPLDSSDPALDVYLCCEDYLSRIEERRVYYAAGEGQRPNRLFISSNKVCFLVYILCMIMFCTFFSPINLLRAVLWPSGCYLLWSLLGLTLPLIKHTVQELLHHQPCSLRA